MDEYHLACMNCNLQLKPQKIAFKYLGYNFYHELPTCPKCGQVYISEDIVKGRIAEVEMNLEDK